MSVIEEEIRILTKNKHWLFYLNYSGDYYPILYNNNTSNSNDDNGGHFVYCKWSICFIWVLVSLFDGRKTVVKEVKRDYLKFTQLISGRARFQFPGSQLADTVFSFFLFVGLYFLLSNIIKRMYSELLYNHQPI